MKTMDLLALHNPFVAQLRRGEIGIDIALFGFVEQCEHLKARVIALEGLRPTAIEHNGERLVSSIPADAVPTVEELEGRVERLIPAWVKQAREQLRKDITEETKT